VVGSVGTGFTDKLRRELAALLWARLRSRPLISCRQRAKWVEPGLYCWTSYMERTKSGELRAPVFEELHLG
jgi:ATP-dependent DNA ligase